ncbi:hypothetical protein Hanom_Chr06g00534201 [Helianthus anomalus]
MLELHKNLYVVLTRCSEREKKNILCCLHNHFMYPSQSTMYECLCVETIMCLYTHPHIHIHGYTIQYTCTNCLETEYWIHETIMQPSHFHFPPTLIIIHALCTSVCNFFRSP